MLKQSKPNGESEPISPQSVANDKREPRSGISIRALLFGLMLIPFLIYWVEYTEIVAIGPDLAAMSLPMAVVFGLLVIIALNVAIKRLAPRLALTQAELLFIYTMSTVSIGISGIGMMQFLTPMLVGWKYFATSENHFSQWSHYIPTWAVPDPSVVQDYYIGKSSFFTAPHLIGWSKPILAWSCFIWTLLFCMYCLASLLRKQWMDSERLIFPIVQIPLEITRDGGDTPLWRNKLLWIGVMIPVVLESMAAIHFTLIPTFPYVPIKPEAVLQLDTGIKDPPWNAIGYTTLAFYPLVIGLTYLVSLDVSFSCWFFYIVTKLEAVAATAFGFRDPGAGPGLARIPYVSEQGVGAFIGLSLFSLYLARPHLVAAWRTAFTKDRTLDDSLEPMSYRAAYIGAIMSAIALVAFLVALGLTVWLALAFFALFFLLVVAFTRIRAEAGLPWGQGPWGLSHGTIVEYSGTENFTHQQLTAFTMTNWFDSDWRCLAMPSQMEAMKIAESAQPQPMNMRVLTKVVLLATVIGIFAAWGSCLYIYYHWGAASAKIEPWRTGQGHDAYDTLNGWLQNAKPIDLPRISAAIGGLLMVTFLSIMRTRFVWWPLHPIGYAIGNTDTMTWIWFPTLIGWLAKNLILRYGGIKTFRKALPFFLGLVFGDYAISGLWALFFLSTGLPGYRTFPI